MVLPTMHPSNAVDQAVEAPVYDQLGAYGCNCCWVDIWKHIFASAQRRQRQQGMGQHILVCSYACLQQHSAVSGNACRNADQDSLNTKLFQALHVFTVTLVVTGHSDTHNSSALSVEYQSPFMACNRLAAVLASTLEDRYQDMLACRQRRQTSACGLLLHFTRHGAQHCITVGRLILRHGQCALSCCHRALCALTVRQVLTDRWQKG
jgi:hypothetical protein